MEKTLKQPNIFKLLVFTYKKYYGNKKASAKILLATFLELLSYVYPLLFSFLLGRMVDRIIYAVNTHGSLSEALPMIILWGSSALIWAILSNISEYCSTNISMWRPYIEDDIYTGKYLEIESKAFEDSDFMLSKGTLGNNSPAVHLALFNSLSILALVPALAISLFVILKVNWVLSVLAILSSVPTAIILKKFGGKVWGIWNDRGEEKIKYNLYRVGVSTGNSEVHQEIRLFGYGRYLLEKAKEINRIFTQRLQDNDKKRYFWTGITSVISQFIFIVAVVYSVKKVLEGELSIGMLTFTIAAYSQLSGNTGKIFKYISSIMGDKSVLEEFYKVQNWKNTIVNGTKKLADVETGIGIEFKDVWFKYPGTDRWIIKGLSFRIDADDDLALVGRNGVGKTTLIKLLERIYDVDKGEILINGMNIKDMNLDSFYEHIGVLSQTFAQLGIPAIENIYLGNVREKLDRAKIINAAKQADIDEAIERLPKGYSTYLSRDVKDGIRLSGGQWQKLAIARAFYRDAKLLILDEPTSAVDALSEEKIFDSIRENAKNKTTLIVSHRFATVRKAKRILVIDNGKIVEDGNHESLMKNNGLYSQMYNTQVNKD